MTEIIKFECPACSATHERGYLDGKEIFRCLNCGYQGYGIHPDPEIERQIVSEIKTNQAINVSFGLPPGPLLP